ncbi:MAG: hypothetical protein ACI9S9_003741, partial [Planctomycetota bacterium]
MKASHASQAIIDMAEGSWVPSYAERSKSAG